MAMHYIKEGNQKISDSSLNGNFSNLWAGKKELIRMVNLVHSTYVPINFTKKKTAPRHSSNPCWLSYKCATGHAQKNVDGSCHNSKNHGGNSHYVYSLNNA
jgi:hypothetical protein